MRALLLILVLLSSPFSGNYPLLHDSALGLCALAAVWLILKRHDIRNHPLLPILGLLLFSTAFAVYQAIDLTAAIKDVAQMSCLCTLSILALSLGEKEQKSIQTFLRILFTGSMALGIYALIHRQQETVWPFRNNYIYGVTLAATLPFVLFWLKGKARYAACMLALVMPFIAPLGVCIVATCGLLAGAVCIKQQRKIAATFSVLLIASCVAGYTLKYDTLSKRGLNDLAINEGTEISQRYVEWIVAGRVLSNYPVLGIGGGNYQKYIGKNYRILPKSNKMPQGGQSGWLVLFIEYGIGGLLAFTALLMLAQKSAIEKCRHCLANDTMSSLFIAVLIMAFSGIFTLLITRETGPLLFILLGVMSCSQQQPTAQDQ